jgi:hypothetical protein
VTPDIVQSEYLERHVFQSDFQCAVDEAGDIVSDPGRWITKAVSQREARAALAGKVREQLPTGVAMRDLEQLAGVLREVDYYSIDSDAPVILVALLGCASTAADPRLRDAALVAAERLAKEFGLTQMLWATRVGPGNTSED